VFAMWIREFEISITSLPDGLTLAARARRDTVFRHLSFRDIYELSRRLAN